MNLTIQEALEQTKKATTAPSYFIFSIRYDKTFLLPYKEAMLLMQALATAEVFDASYSDTKITPLATNDYTVSPISQEEVHHIRTANLLGMPYDDFKKARIQSKEEANESA